MGAGILIFWLFAVTVGEGEGEGENSTSGALALPALSSGGVLYFQQRICMVWIFSFAGGGGASFVLGRSLARYSIYLSIRCFSTTSSYLPTYVSLSIYLPTYLT